MSQYGVCIVRDKCPALPYSPDLAPSDFFLFQKLKMKLTGRRFQTLEEIQTELQAVVNALRENDFQECFKKWQRCCDRCQASEGDTSVPLCTAHSTHAMLGHAATPLHNKLRRNLTECFNINITLARLSYMLPDEGCRPKRVGAI